MSELHLPWLELAILIPAIGAIFVAQLKDSLVARHWCVGLTGVSLPGICRSYIEEGVVQSVVMWKTRNLGYLVGASAQALASGALQPGAVSFRAGRLGSVVVQKDEIRLGRCHIVTRGNLADFE